MVFEDSSETKLVFIAHPVSGDFENNIQKILLTCRDIHTNFKGYVPFVPYIANVHYLNTSPEEKILGMKATRILFERNVIDEFWLCGDCISEGMKEGLRWSIEFGISIKAYNPHLQDDFLDWLEEVGIKFN